MRSTLGVALSLGMVLCCAPALPGSEGAITTTRLNDHLYQLSTDQGSYTTNSLVSVGPDGVLIVDTQAREVADELREVVEGFGKGRPKIIINTHRHVEHVGGNSVFGGEPIVIAHGRVRGKLRSGSYLFEEFPDSTLPDVSFTDELDVYFNGERIHLVAMPGSHDDNEIIVHFTGSKVVHLSSLANGFNFPSVDSDGSALAFPELVARALDLLPPDVLIVSGHNRNGTIEDLRAYHGMLVSTIAVVRQGLAAGKTVEELQAEQAVARWSAYAGSYVSQDGWITSIADAIESAGVPRKPKAFEVLYHQLQDHGAEAAVRLYEEIRDTRADEFDLGEHDLLVVGMKLEGRDDHEAAVPFLRASLRLHPDSEYGAFTLLLLARAEEALGQRAAALEHARRALLLDPDSEEIGSLVERLEQAAGETPVRAGSPTG